MVCFRIYEAKLVCAATFVKRKQSARAPGENETFQQSLDVQLVEILHPVFINGFGTVYFNNIKKKKKTHSKAFRTEFG